MAEITTVSRRVQASFWVPRRGGTAPRSG